MKKTNLLPLFGASLALLLSSCGNKTGEKTTDTSDQNKEQKLTGAVNVDGSSTVYPITEAVAEEFKTVQPDIKVTAGTSGTGGGFKKFGRGETDINDASRPIKNAEDSLAKSNNVSYIDLMIAYDGLAVVVNPKNDWCKDITVAELKKMWEPTAQGKIKKWNQIRASWPNEEIHLFGAGVESGTYDYFTEAIVGKSHSSRGDYTASEDDNVLVQGISSDKFALGFFGLAYFEENKDKLNLVGVDDEKDENGKGPITPSIESVKNKSYSPLARPLFIYVNSTAGKRKEVQEFVKFYLENMGSLTKQVGYIPLSDDETAKEKSKWEGFVKSVSAGQ
ncbi:MAG: PstS family phosphate ABC transporter substrate-binding protein [Bacteroidia bacterium]